MGEAYRKIARRASVQSQAKDQTDVPAGKDDLILVQGNGIALQAVCEVMTP
jgi:hypothetical protein